MPASLDAPIGDDDGNLGDVVIDTRVPSPEDAVVASQAVEHVHDALSTLDAREREVLVLRFGIEAGREHTLAEIGTRLNLSRERVRQIEAAALSKLRTGRGRAA
jgi:RNA polymerase primary sigma factor